MSHPTPPAPTKPGSHLAAGITAAEAVTRPTRTRSGTPAREPSMRALVRILGTEVLDIFPEGIIETVDALAKDHAADKAKYAWVVFDSEDEAADALALMRAYAESTTDPGVSIRQDKATEPNELRFRVTFRKAGDDSDE